MENTHTMDLINIKDGYQEWKCPICGRHLLIKPEPWEKIVLKAGDVSAEHVGNIVSPQLQEEKENQPDLEPDPQTLWVFNNFVQEITGLDDL